MSQQPVNITPFHVAIIMDGNGRWAKERHLSRVHGHREGAKALRHIIEEAPSLGINNLTFFGFSTENWRRPADEVNELMGLMRQYLTHEIKDFHKQGAKLRIVGERNGLDDDLRHLMDHAETLTQNNHAIEVVLAINYGGRADILSATRHIADQVAQGKLQLTDIDEHVFEHHLWTKGLPDPDLLIRTSGEQRLSNFLLWQMAYTEFVFNPCYWPDFTKQDLAAAIDIYQHRIRRFGAL